MELREGRGRVPEGMAAVLTDIERKDPGEAELIRAI